MTNLNLEQYLEMANTEKEKKGLENYVPLYPMFRVEDGKLYIGVMFTEEQDNVWDKDQHVKAKYWTLIDVHDNRIVAFNNTEEKDFVIGDLIHKNVDKKEQELSKYTVEKMLQYKNYFMEDIKKEQLPLQKKLAEILGNEMEVDDQKVNINDYLFSMLEDEIKVKINELVDTLIQSKYESISIYYNNLFTQIIRDYQEKQVIDHEKLKLCMEIMNNYYDGVIGIDNFFNLS